MPSIVIEPQNPSVSDLLLHRLMSKKFFVCVCVYFEGGTFFSV